jgi:hypothetical protein
MSLAHDAQRHVRPAVPAPRFRSAGTRTSEPNTITASQARAARRREARRDEQAVAAWLRELATRPR